MFFGLYLYRYKIYGTITLYFKSSSSCLSLDTNFTSLALSSVKLYSFEYGIKRTLAEIRVILTTQPLGN